MKTQLTFDHKQSNFGRAVLLNGVALMDIKVDNCQDAVSNFAKELPDKYSFLQSTSLLLKHMPSVSTACAVAYRIGTMNKKDPTPLYQVVVAKMSSTEGEVATTKSKIAEFFWTDMFQSYPFEEDENKILVAFFHFLGQFFHA